MNIAGTNELILNVVIACASAPPREGVLLSRSLPLAIV